MVELFPAVWESPLASLTKFLGSLLTRQPLFYGSKAGAYVCGLHYGLSFWLLAVLLAVEGSYLVQQFCFHRRTQRWGVLQRNVEVLSRSLEDARAERLQFSSLPTRVGA